MRREEELLLRDVVEEEVHLEGEVRIEEVVVSNRRVLASELHEAEEEVDGCSLLVSKQGYQEC